MGKDVFFFQVSILLRNSLRTDKSKVNEQCATKIIQWIDSKV